jgi:hypothetical protein
MRAFLHTDKTEAATWCSLPDIKAWPVIFDNQLEFVLEAAEDHDDGCPRGVFGHIAERLLRNAVDGRRNSGCYRGRDIAQLESGGARSSRPEVTEQLSESDF